MRFPEFTEPWKSSTIGECCSSLEYGMNAAAKEFDGRNKYIRITDIDENTSTYSNQDVVSPSGVLEDKYLVRENDILFARTGASVGKTYHYDKTDGKLYFAGFLIRGGVLPCFNSKFVFFQTQLSRYKKWVTIMSARSGQPGINSQEYESFNLFIPTRTEQNKIATFIELLDKRIAVQSKLIEQLQSLMGGIMVAHYNKCKKQVVQIKELGDYFTVMNLSKDNLTDEGNDCVLYGELFTTYHCTISEIKSKTNLTTGLTFSQSNDLLFPSSTTVDAVSLIAPSAITVPNVVLGGDMFGLHINERYSNVYLAFLFNYILKQRLAKYAQGSTIIHLHFNDICNAKIEVPNLTDQLTFVELSSKVQQKIATEISMLANLQALKSYLLQQMFI